MKNKTASLLPTLLCSSFLILTACSSGGNSGGEPAPTVIPQSCTEDCGDISNGEQARVLSIDTPLSLSVEQRDIRVFEVQSG